MAQLSCLQTLVGHSDRVWQVCWSPDGSRFASCSGDRTVRLWSKAGASWTTTATLEGAHERTIRSVCWSPDGRFLACASFDATASIWLLRNGEFECVATLEGHEHEVKSIAWHPSKPLLATCSRDKSVWIWSLESGETEWDCQSVLHGHSQDVKSVRWHPKMDELLSCSYDDTIRVWHEDDDEQDWSVAEVLAGHTSTVWEMAFDPSEPSRFASASDDGTVKIWRRLPPDNQYRCVSTLSGYHPRTVFSLDWSTSGLLATACADDAIRIFTSQPPATSADPPSWAQALRQPKAHASDVNCVRFCPADPSLLVSAGDDGLVKVWKVAL